MMPQLPGGLNPLYPWLTAFAIGFHFREKLPLWAKKVLGILGILTLLTLPLLFFIRRGSASSLPAPQRPPRVRADGPRLLTKLEPPPASLLNRLKEERQEEEQRKKESERQAQQKAEPKEQKAEAKNALGWNSSPSMSGLISNDGTSVGTGTVTVITDGVSSTVTAATVASSTVANSTGTITFSSGSVTMTGMVVPENYERHLKGQRKGPFCHITCSFHHGYRQEVEALPEYCQANTISPKAVDVRGWHSFPNYNPEYEYLVPWPGPATPGGGLDSYKLYWKQERGR